MKSSFYSLSLIALFLAASCNKKKDLPKEESGIPVFYFKGDLEGIPLNLEAGNNNYYMYSSHYQDTTGVYVFKGNIRKDNCDSTCDYGVTILINDAKATPATAPIGIHTALHTGEYIFNDASLPPMYYKATFKPLKIKDSSHIYKWEVTGGGRTFIGNQYYADFILNAGQAYSVFFGDKSSDCDTVHWNDYKADTIFQTIVTAKKQPIQFAYDFSTTTVGEGPYTYSWNFGDDKPTSTSTLATPSHTYAGKAKGFYRVRVSIKDSKNDSCVSYYQINANPDKSCDANFQAKFLKIPNTRAYEAVTIIITKPGGEVYSTKNVIQPEESSFEVLSVNDYDTNINNEPTKRLKVKLNCILKNGNKEIKLTNAEAMFAMSYK